MAKKNNPKPVNKGKGPIQTDFFTRGNFLLLGLCLAVTGGIYIYSALHNQLTNWDDNIYINENRLIQTWDTELFTARVNANWAPVHQYLLAIEYHLFGLMPTGYHVVSLLLHLCNVALVFFVVLKLSKINIVAAMVALLFGIHPMHAEPVVWVSSQKDLLFTLFYLLAVLAYSKYQERRNDAGYTSYLYLLLVFVFFILSCLSKGMGETLPVTLVLMDCFNQNNWNWKFIAKSILSKALFFAAAIGFGITAYIALKNGGALDIPFEHSLPEQLMFVCYGLLVYLVKFIAPFSLSPLYLYPIKDASGHYPAIYYASPAILLVIAGLLCWWLVQRHKQGKSNNILLFGLLFFLANMILVLQLKSITVVIAAERYTYLAYVGLLFIVAQMLYNLWDKRKSRNLVLAVLAAVVIMFSISATSYANVWYDSISLWTYAINNFPSYPLMAKTSPYVNRGDAYIRIGKLEQAVTDYTTAISLDPKFNLPFSNRALAEARMGLTKAALADCDSAISLKPDYYAAWYNKGVIYAQLDQEDSAIAEYTQAISLNPRYADIYNDRGLAYFKIGKAQQALADYNSAMQVAPYYFLPYYNRGLLYAQFNKPDLALDDFNTSIELNPHYVDTYNDRGRAYFQLGKPELALADYNTAIGLNPNFVLPYFNRARLRASRGANDMAIKDYNIAIGLNPKFAEAYYARGIAEEASGDYHTAQADIEKAKSLGLKMGN